MIKNSIEIIYLRFLYILALLILVFLTLCTQHFERYEIEFTISLYMLIILGLTLTALNSIFSSIISIAIIFFYVQRIFVLVVAENNSVYYEYIKFLPNDHSNSVSYILLCIISLAIGVIASNSLFGKLVRVNDFKTNHEQINQLLFIGMIFSIPLYIFNLILFYNRIGIVGEVYSNEISLYLWVKKIPEILSVCSVISIIYFKDNKILYRLAKINIAMLFLLSIVSGSKGFLLATLLMWYIIKKYKDNEVSYKFLNLSIIVLILSIFLVFPLMSAIRDSILNNSIRTLDFTPYRFILNFSYRLNNYESVLLWMHNSTYQEGNLRSIYSDFVEIINGFWVGDLINYEQVDLSKYQLLKGYGIDRMGELGGHSETLGGIASAFVYFGYLGGILFFLIWGFILRTIEQLYRNKIYLSLIIYYYAAVWFLSGGNIIIHNSLALFILIIMTYNVLKINFYKINVH